MADDGRLAFDIELMEDAFHAQAERIIGEFEKIGQSAVNEGKHIDAVFADLSKGYDVSTIEERMNALRSVIAENENTVVSLTSKIKKMGEEARQALASEDYATFRTLRNSITDAQKEIVRIKADTKDYEHILNEVAQAAGKATAAMPHETARFFTSEEDYNHAKQLTAQIEELRIKLADTFDQAERNTINGQIIELQGELDGLNKSAANAASALGDKMGSRAAEVSTRFYELNAAVKEQKQKFDELNEQLVDTEKELTAATQAGDVNKVAALQQKYSYLADQVRNTGDALADLEGQQKDAEGAFDSLQNQIGGVVDAIGNLTSGKASFRTIITSIRQLSGLFKKSGTGLTAFNTGLRGMGGAANLAKLSIKGLWATITANPIGAIVAAIAGLIAIMVKLAQSIKTTSDKQLEAAQIEAADLKYTESVAKRKMDAYDEAIRAKQREIDVAKSANKSNTEIYKLEDERYRLQRDKAKWQEGYFGDYIANLDTEYAKLDDLNKQLRAAEDAQISGESKFEITIDGKTNKADIEKQIDILKQMIENTEANIKIGVDAKEAVAVADADQKKYENEKRQQARQTANVERQALRDAANARIELMGDSYAREVAMAQESSKNRISDLRRRLKEEANLTVAARKAINENIETEEKALQKRLLDLERSHVQEVKDLWRDVEDLQASARPQTMSQEGMNLWRKYLQEDANIQRQIEVEENPQKREALLAKQKALYEKYLYDREQLGKQHAERVTANEEQAIKLRLEAAQEGSAEEFQLKLQLIEKQRQAELERNRHLVEEQRQDEAAINAKYDRQRENTQKEYYDNLYEQYGSFEQRRQQIAEKYAKKRDNLYTKDADGNKTLAPGVSQANIDEINRQEREAYQQLQLEFSAMLAQNDSNYAAWLRRIDELTVSELENLLSKSKKTLADLFQRQPAGDITVDPAEIEKLMAKIAELEAKIKEANLSPSEKSAEKWKKWGEQITNLGSEISSLGDAVGGTVGEVIAGIGEMVNYAGIAMEKGAEIAANGIKTIEDASVILAMVSALVQLTKTLNNALESIGVNTTDPLVRAYNDWLREQNKAAKELEREYDALGKAINKAFSTDKAQLLTRQIQIAEEQLSNLRKEYDALLVKQEKYANNWWYKLWGTDLSEEEKDRLEELGYEIEDQQKKIEELRQAAVDAIFGSDIQSAIEKFAEAYTNAWQNGTDAAEAGRDVVKEILKDVVTEALKAAIVASGKVEDIRRAVALAVGRMMGGTAGTNIIADAFGYGDIPLGLGSVFARMLMAMGTAEDAINSAYATADELTGVSDVYRQIMEGFGLLDDVASDRSAQAAGLQSVSQESFDATSGRITSIQGHTFIISENSNIIRDNIAAINGNVAMIRDYTSHLVRMDEDMRDMKNNVQTIRQSVSILAGQ